MVAPIIEVTQIPAALTGRGSLLGLDLGTKTIGVAVCDPGGMIATPVTTVRRTKFQADAAQLIELARTWKARAYVLGLPTNMDGSEGPRAQATRAFARNFARLQDLPIALWDERLSTAAVERMLIDQDMSRAKRAAVVDQHAAAFILQGAIDRLRSLRPAV